jgi:hypothetical protein
VYEAEGLAVQRAILGRMLGYFATEVGPLNQVVHLWVYDDHGDRARRRAALAADDRWLAYVRRAKGLVVSQETRIMVPAPFLVERLSVFAGL